MPYGLVLAYASSETRTKMKRVDFILRIGFVPGWMFDDVSGLSATILDTLVSRVVFNPPSRKCHFASQLGQTNANAEAMGSNPVEAPKTF